MEPNQVDHKDKPGPHREQVRAGVFSRLGAVGKPLSSRDQLLGDWLVHFIGIRGQKSSKPLVYRLRENGQAIIEVPGQPQSPNNRWRLNADGSFSMLVWCDAMPDYGLPEPTYEEMREHIAALPDRQFVIWNGDGSLVQLLSPLPNEQQLVDSAHLPH